MTVTFHPINPNKPTIMVTEKKQLKRGNLENVQKLKKGVVEKSAG